ncbi:MAG: BAX inhibitor (BI)-1/YccA family protein, partial [Hyphomicrobiales bacterium]
MANQQRQTMGVGSRSGATATIDQGLRTYMLKVYNYMASGVAITGIVAYLAFSMAFVQTPTGLQLTDLGMTLYGSPLKWVVML